VCKRGLSAADKQSILDKHNELRALAAAGGLSADEGRQTTPAGTIGSLQWDENLVIGSQM